MKSKAHGYLFALAATTIFSLQDAVSKHLGDHYPPIFVTMIRYWAFGAFCILLASRKRGGLRAAVRTTRPVLQVVRGVLLAVEIMVVITAFAHAGLAHSTAVLSATPILVTLLSIPLLGERVGWRRWSAITAGLVGVLLILKPDASGFLDPWLLLPVACCVMYAIYLIATRLVSRTDAPATSFFYTGVAGAVAATLVRPFFWADLQGWDRAWMGLLCITGMTGHYLVIRAYELVDASRHASSPTHACCRSRVPTARGTFVISAAQTSCSPRTRFCRETQNRLQSSPGPSSFWTKRRQ